MEAQSDDVKIKTNGWKQFSILDNQDGKLENTPKGKYLVASHPCDIVQRSFDKEKKVEIILLNELAAPLKSQTGLKNFRAPHVAASDNGVIKFYEIDMNNRSFIERAILAERFPILGISFDNITEKTIIQLLFARYKRTALPDEFNQRFPLDKIKKILNGHSEDTYSLLIDIAQNEELQAGETYNIRLRMLVVDRSKDHDQLLEDIVKVTNTGINVVEYRVKTLEEISLAEYYEFTQLWLVELSYRGDEADPHL